jgi:hypothetical protein
MISRLLLLIFAFSLLLSGCTEKAVKVEPGESRDLPEEAFQSVEEPAATPTLTDEEINYRSKFPPGPTPTPLPMEINAYGCEPGIFHTQAKEPLMGQIVVYINQIVYNWGEQGSIELLLKNRPAKDIKITGISLFEAQDLIVGILVSPRAPEGVYDARLKIGDKTFLLERMFKVRRDSPPSLSPGQE